MQTSLQLPPELSLRDVVGWDSATWARAIAFWLDETRVPLAGARVLEVGAASGGLSLYLGALGANVVCTDRSMPVDAQAQRPRYRIKGRIEYRALDLTDWPADLGKFDVIVEKSVIGGVGAPDLDSQRRAIASIMNALKPGGEYWFADNLRGSIVHALLRRAFLSRYDQWHYYDGVDELLGLFPAGIETCVTKLGLLGLFGRTEDQREALSRLENSLALEKLLPAGWRYVAAGIARHALGADPSLRSG